ncbi:MAG: hypothetical protein RLO50_15505 [Azospirillaceae bacterium]
MGLFASLRRKEMLADAGDLARFLDSRAAFMSQKGVVEYCRVRAGLMWSKLFLEKDFLAAMERCRWEAYAACLADLAVLMEAKLRPPLENAGRSEEIPDLVPGLMLLVADCVTAHGKPAALPDGWQGWIEVIRGRLEQAQLAAPRLAQDIGREAGRTVFRYLPIHASLRGEDFPMVQNNLRFHLVRIAEDFDRTADHAALAVSVASLGRRGAR